MDVWARALLGGVAEQGVKVQMGGGWWQGAQAWPCGMLRPTSASTSTPAMLYDTYSHSPHVSPHPAALSTQ